MAKLAIRGHATRGREVIELLEMLGGINKHQITAIKETYVYFVDEDGIIRLLKIQQLLPEQFIVFTLEVFLKKFPYKIGDEVIIKKKNQIATVEKITWCCDTITYWLKYGGYIEGNWRAEYLQPYKEKTMEEELMPKIDFSKYSKNKYLLDMGDYEIKVEDGKTYVVRKKPQYQKTYEECCEILNVINTEMPHIILSQLGKPITSLAKLIVCRDAYWKIAGEQMGLGKAWEPVWTESNPKYTIAVVENGLVKTFALTQNYILAFPTEEMRDAFYENFKDLIEECKELL